MSINTNLAGRLRNTKLPITAGLLPLHEAIVNSLQALEEAGIPSNDGRIDVEISRDTSQGQLDFQDSKKPGRNPLDEIVGFMVSDNGIGFTAENMESFETLDSDRKVAVGGRGIGRLLWLKAFEQVSIESVYSADENKRERRTFTFDMDSGVDAMKVEPTDVSVANKTVVQLSRFVPRYRRYVPKTAESIARNIVEHCLWYFLREGGAPNITIQDGDERINLDHVFHNYMHSQATTVVVDIKDQKFELIHVQLHAVSNRSHSIAFCANNRLVFEQRLEGRIPGLHSKLSDPDRDFLYSCYISSPFLDDSVRPERTGFEIVKSSDGLFADTEITQDDIESAVIEKAKDKLSSYLVENLRKAKDRISQFVSDKAPRYRPILARIPEDELNIDPDISDKELELALHKQLAQIERELLRDGHDIMNLQSEEAASDYKKRLSEYLRKAEDIKMSDLAGYVAHRKIILDLLERALEQSADGKYVREDVIHQLIMPMRQESNDVLSDACNLWIIDDKLAFHDYLASDKALVSIPITASEARKEPDLLAFNLYDNPTLVSEGQDVQLASITLIEIKRPMRNDARSGEDKDPIEQVLGYLSRIRDGTVKTSRGRPIPESANIPGFCYVLCDLTSTIRDRCKLASLKPMPDDLGFFGYNDNFKAYIEVIGFDRLLRLAKQRNRAFFDKLGLPTN